MRWVEVGNTDIYYVEEGSGEPLVFLHGMSSCSEAWFQQFEAFSSRLRVIGYDSVNHGHSSNSPRDEPEPDRADELEGFLSALGIENPILAGNSMGALTILRWASRHPDSAAALVPSGMGILQLSESEGPSESDRETEAGAPRRRRLFDPIDKETLFLPVADSLTDGLRQREPRLFERYLRIRSTATRLEAMRHPRTPTMRNPGREELATAVKAIVSPMLVVVGELDWLRPAAERLHALVPHSRYVMIPGSPHNVYYETAKEYNAAVTEFLRSLGSESS